MLLPTWFILSTFVTKLHLHWQLNKVFVLFCSVIRNKYQRSPEIWAVLNDMFISVLYYVAILPLLCLWESEGIAWNFWILIFSSCSHDAPGSLHFRSAVVVFLLLFYILLLPPPTDLDSIPAFLRESYGVSMEILLTENQNVPEEISVSSFSLLHTWCVWFIVFVWRFTDLGLGFLSCRFPQLVSSLSHMVWMYIVAFSVIYIYI